MKKFISALIVTAMMIPTAVPMTALADNAVNNSVSGYISADTGVKLIGKDKQAKIYVDSNDYESVIRAVGDMKDDLSDVSGQTVTINADIQSMSDEVKISGINISSASMSVDGYKLLTENGKGIIAVYNTDGTIEKVLISEDNINSTNGTAHFKELPSFEGKTVKAFAWKTENDKLTVTPIANSYTYTETPKATMPADNDWSDANIIVGTLGNSKAIDSLAEMGAIDVSEIKDKWESFTVQENGGNLIIAGSDKRGTIYGIYDFCEKIGVSPWKWWADVKPKKADELYINLPKDGYTEDEPSVQYRGIFLNDEYNLNQWSTSMGDGNMNKETYEKIYELILRLKANTLWPAMHQYSNAFHLDAENAVLADKYGIVMGSSHAEPLLRNNLGELYPYQQQWLADHPDKKLYINTKDDSGRSVSYMWTDHDGDGNAVDNKEFLADYWRDSVKTNGSYENIYTLGMRGVHDGSFSTNMDTTTALNEIIATQRKILEEELCTDGRKIEDIPQIFIPYKDVQAIYNTGALKIPDDVTIMWTDDNYGYVRQNADDAERARAGKTGIYYHISYYGYPTSYLWLSSTQPGLIREELKKSYDMGANKVWILNVGDLKPAEKEIEYFADLAKNVWSTSNTEISSIYEQNAKRDFNMNETDAKEYADIMDKYYEIANAKRPEFLRTGDFSMTAYGDEGERYINEYKDICARAEKLYEKLPTDKQASFFELALYPIRTATNMAIDYVQTDRANLYVSQNRGAAANKYAEEADNAVKQINTDMAYYNSMLDGKWNNIMNNNPSKLQGCDAHITTELNAPKVSSLDYTELAVMTDSQMDYSDNPTMTVSTYDTYDKFIDVINKGYGGLDYEITSDSNALVFDKTSGTSYGSDRVHISVDKSKAADGVNNATVTVEQKIGDNVLDTKQIAVTIENPTEQISEKTYVEAGGVVSIEAEHYTDKFDVNGYEWKEEKDFGRSGNTMKAYPETASNAKESDLTNSAAYMEYKVYFTNVGSYTLDVYRMPTLNERGTMRLAVAIDDGTPTVLSGTNKYSGSRSKTDAWSKGVLCNSEKLTTKINVSEAGYHTVRVYNVSTGVVIDKMLLSKNNINSYFGAPESYNTTYNTTKETSTVTEDTEVSGIDKTYEPKAVVGNVSVENNNVKTVDLIGLTENTQNAVVFTVGYDKDGNAVSTAMNKAEINGKTTVNVNLALADNATSYAIYVVDNLTDMQPIAPFKTFGKIKAEAEDNYITLKTDFSSLYGKKSVVLAADCEISEDITADNIKYVYGETLDSDSYKYIPWNEEEGKYYIRVGVDKDSTYDETKNTVKNITPDTQGEETQVSLWKFDTDLNDTNGANAFTLTGDTVNNNGQILMNNSTKGTSTGSASMQYAKPVVTSQGETLTVEFDITFGKHSGKTMSYSLTDANGKAIVSTQICAYDLSGNTNVKIGGNDVLDDYSKLSAAISRGNNSSSSNKPTHFKNVIDFGSNKAYVTVSYDGGQTAEFTGKIGDSTGSLGGINFSSNHGYADRSCIVDNVSIGKVSGPQYKMTFGAVDSKSKESVDANIVVKDGISGAVLTPNSNGEYLLCEGDYLISATADGYRDAGQKLELSQATESKNITVPMVSVMDLTKADIAIEFKDNQGNDIMESVTETGDFYVGDKYTVSADYRKDQVVKRDGKVYTYKYNAEKSVYTEDKLEENNIFTIVYDVGGEYDFYADFENYTIDDSALTYGGGNPKLTVANDNENSYLSYASTGSTVGVWQKFDTIDCTNKTVTVNADIKFAPKGTAGNSQFSIGDTSPKFDSNNVNYGFVNKSKKYDGHIIAVEYNSGSTLLVNGQTVSSDFVGSWIHLNAEINFATKKINVTLKNDSDITAELNDLDFYSSNDITEIGSFYLRAAKSNGTVGLDNLTMVSEDITE